MIVIINYGMGNINSIYHKLQKHTDNIIVTNDKVEIEKANKIILPGVGHFAKGMENIRSLGLIDILNNKVLRENTPIFGICLGMQLMTEGSEEGNAKGLGWIKGNTKLFKFDGINTDLPVPNVGWREINIIIKNEKYSKGIRSDDKFYFTHSYYINCEDKNDISSTSYYGFEFVASIKKNNIIGTQFHPEKSHIRGFDILKRFAFS